MRKLMLKTISGVTLAILLALTLSQALVSGQGAREYQPQDAAENGLPEASELSAQARRLVGTWRVEVTLRNCQTGDPIRSFPSLVTYARGGTVLETTSGISPTLRYPGQGVWHHRRGRHYSGSFMFFRFNPDGSYAGTQIIRQDIELSRDGDELSITATVEVLDANDNVIGTGCVTSTATRFQ